MVSPMSTPSKPKPDAKPKPPEIIDLDASAVAELRQRIAARQLSERDYEIFAAILATYRFLVNRLTSKRITIPRLKKLLFGASTETTAAVLGSLADDATLPAAGEPDRSDASNSSPSDAPPKRRKGHGRNGADDYPGAQRIVVPHESLQPGDYCLECQDGTLYELRPPATLIRLVGQAPVQAAIYELQRLRCKLCGKVFTAQVPEGVGPDKYDLTVASIIGLLKYGRGVPFYRLAGLQQDLGIPLPAATQWKVVHEAVPSFVPAYEELFRQAACGEVVYHDDTNNRILELMGQRWIKAQMQQASRAGPSEAEGNAPPDPDPGDERRGIFTSGIVSTAAGQRIALFFTGRQHAGENLRDVLAQRAKELPPPIQMCDALSRNMPAELNTILANCLAHGRRQFVDIVEHFPQECRYVLEALKVVYKNDAVARQKQLSPEARLQFHKSQSGPVMDDLQAWLQRHIDEHLVEPNSGLGQAINYLLKRWDKFTLFLRQAGAPLDNNLCERALKKVILHRKNALFYKTENGAHTGDIYMSLIYTCELCGANPFDYLTQLQRHAQEVAAHPASWMPWNYRETLTVLPAATNPAATATTSTPWTTVS